MEAEEARAESLIEEFEHEEHLKSFYSCDSGQKRIRLDEIPELGNKPFYVTMDTKEVTSKLDLKKEVVLTMLNQLEQVEDSFFRVDSILPAYVSVRFHKAALEELAETDKFFAAFARLASPVQGVHRCPLANLAVELNVKPFSIPRILYSIQHDGSGRITYDVDKESFVLQMTSIPAPAAAMPLAQAMLEATRKIESALVQKLNCMYFVARKVSMPTVESMHKKEKM